jgi:hypothetical protein
MNRAAFLGVAAALTGAAAASAQTPPSPAPAPSEAAGPSAKALALQWFRALQAGRVDRTKLTKEYSDHLSDSDIVNMSRYLKPYGDAREVDVLLSRTVGNQTFYEYKLIFSRGDALAMLMGFDRDGKITAVTFSSMGQS